MSFKDDILAPARQFTGVLKDFFWWLAGLGIVVGLAKTYLGPEWFSVCVQTVAVILISYFFIRSSVYRRRNNRIYQATKFIHTAIHNLRNRLGQELEYLDQFSEESTPTEEAMADASIQVLHEVLQEIVNACSSFFRELTGHQCVAVLLMPERSEEDGAHFKARLYSINASRERTEQARPHKSGLIADAFKATGVLCCPDLKEEMKKGNFGKRGDNDPFKWYRSTMLCHFKVQGEPWGILSLDSPKIRAFRPHYAELLRLC